MCPPMRADWRHLANTIELMLLSAHPSPQRKRQIDRFSHFCTAHGRKSLYFTLCVPIPQNCPFPDGSKPPSNTWFLGPTRVLNSNDMSIASAFFAGLTSVTDRQRDRPTYHAMQSVTIGRTTYVVLRCGLIMCKLKQNAKNTVGC